MDLLTSGVVRRTLGISQGFQEIFGDFGGYFKVSGGTQGCWEGLRGLKGVSRTSGVVREP